MNISTEDWKEYKNYLEAHYQKRLKDFNEDTSKQELIKSSCEETKGNSFLAEVIRFDTCLMIKILWTPHKEKPTWEGYMDWRENGSPNS